jgi:hypothetical protein
MNVHPASKLDALLTRSGICKRPAKRRKTAVRCSGFDTRTGMMLAHVRETDKPRKFHDDAISKSKIRMGYRVNMIIVNPIVNITAPPRTPTHVWA